MVNKSSDKFPTTEPLPLEEASLTEFSRMVSDYSSLPNDDRPGYDEPQCSWTPAGAESDNNCGEGVDCPPCD
ncbi:MULTISPECIES: hypothetical protein [unclassified Coleofasciculus]|uniref:hypothetical protein n=1 Tax=unclassified Coleofasciculus TaxID=2692782 RepID=UPI0018820640|nr:MULTISPECIES: hypothetical protein [unclassified Coleofasciculus]MBE9127206.1 hypothetical protein [Coleofasciculus sp. LEGE 07081]MBE9150316.1 hypothetical protein [Coleofasciculus sp. LEGE 07092]